ncbi:MAG: LacI family DNA-binding transcriptional regulator [Gordonia sp. (in: high G+C Gram-positive bacteria)]
MTAKDVAAHAGVSIATISMVANGKAQGRVSPSTQIRVENAIKELGYVVNSAARSLVTGRNGRIALLANDITNPFIVSIAKGVNEVLGADTRLVLSESGPLSPVDIASMGVDAMIVDLADANIEIIVGAGLPVVILDEPDLPATLARVYFDLEHGSRELAEHLVQLGHRIIVYLDSGRARTSFDIRRTHLSREFRRLAGKGSKVIRAHSDLDIQAAERAVRNGIDRWLHQGATAIVTATDIQAYGVLGALHSRGITVPDEVSVASYDNNAFSRVVGPPLTTVNLPARDLGRQSAMLLTEQVSRGSNTARTVILPTTLIVRSSTGKANR